MSPPPTHRPRGARVVLTKEEVRQIVEEQFSQPQPQPRKNSSAQRPRPAARPATSGDTADLAWWRSVTTAEARSCTDDIQRALDDAANGQPSDADHLARALALAQLLGNEHAVAMALEAVLATTQAAHSELGGASPSISIDARARAVEQFIEAGHRCQALLGSAAARPEVEAALRAAEMALHLLVSARTHEQLARRMPDPRRFRL